MTYSKQFTHDFYRLVNINADSTRSLQSKKSFNKKSNLKNNTEEDDEEDDGGLIDDTENDNLSQLSTDSSCSRSSSSSNCSNTSSCCNLTTLQQQQPNDGGNLATTLSNNKKKKRKKQLLTTKQIDKIKLKLNNNSNSVNNHHNNILMNNYNNRRFSRSNCNSPTPSEAGRAELISCSSSSDSISIDSSRVDNLQIINNDDNLLIRQRNSFPIQFKYNQKSQHRQKHIHQPRHHYHQQQEQSRNIDDFLLQSSNDWPLSNGWHSKQLNVSKIIFHQQENITPIFKFYFQNTNLTSNNLPTINSFNNSKIIKTTGIPVATQQSHQTTIINGVLPIVPTTGNQTPTTIIPTTVTPTPAPATTTIPIKNNNNKIKSQISKLNKQQKPPPVPIRRSAAS